MDKAGCKRDRFLENEISILPIMVWRKTRQLKQEAPGSALNTALTGGRPFAGRFSTCKLYLNTHLAYMRFHISSAKRSLLKKTHKSCGEVKISAQLKLKPKSVIKRAGALFVLCADPFTSEGNFDICPR